MKKTRILALLLAVLMLSSSLLVACKKDKEEDPCADGHQWNKKEVTIEKRTCTESGIKERTCKVCKLTEQYEWKPEGHTIARAEWIYNDDATCFKDGTETRTCALCPYFETRTKVGSMVPHDFNYYVLANDGYSETATCGICSEVTHTRLVGIKVDFEGDRNTMSYDAVSVYTPDGVTDYYKTETVGDKTNTFVQIDRTDAIGIGDHGYGLFLKPGYQRLKTGKYVVEFDVKINKDSTKDLVLLSGIKDLATVDFLTYDAETKTISITYGPVYTLKDSTDFDRWMKIGVVFNDIDRKYEFYIDDKLVIAGIDYQNESYFAGMDLENFKIGMTHEVGAASTFSIDNIDIYIAYSPKGYENEAIDRDYDVFETEHSKDKIMYKKLLPDCSHSSKTEKIVPADCFNDGYKYQECDECHGWTVPETTDAKKEHKDETGESTMVQYDIKESTCTEYGAIYRECSLCGFKDREPLKMKEHEIDKDAPSYLDKPADCINDGSITGECKVCHCAMTLFNGQYKYGHNIPEVTVGREATCDSSGYSTGKCINPGCGETITVNEIDALGHVMKTQIVKDDKGIDQIESYCLRCCKSEEDKVRQPLSTAGVYPTQAQIIEMLGTNYYGGTDGEGFTNGMFSLGASANIKMSFANNNTKSSATRMIETGNYFLRFKHVPGDKESYLNILDEKNRRANEDVVVEIALRLPKTGAIASMNVTAAQRITGHNVVFNLFSVDSNGVVKFIPGDIIIGTLTSERFIRLSFVIKPGTGAVDAYFDGELKSQNALMKTGQTDFVPAGGVVYEYRFGFGHIASGEKSIDVDDMFMYQASMPVYVTNPIIADATNRDYNSENNSTDNNGLYINNAANLIGTNMNISSNNNFRAYVLDDVVGADGYKLSVLHCLKGENIKTIASAANSDESEISSYSDIMKSAHAVIYNEIKFNSGSFTDGKMNSGRIVLAQGSKIVNNSLKLQDFLVLKNGELRTGGEDEDSKYLYTPKENEWISYNVVVDEGRGTYSIYINGICRASGVKFSEEYIAAKYDTCGYKFMVISGGEFDFYMANTALYTGAVAPLSEVTTGKVESVVVTTDVHKKHDAVVFYEDRSLSSYYDYEGEIVLSGGALVKAPSGAKKGAISVEKIEKPDGDKTKTVTVLKTTDYATNNLSSIEFNTLLNTKLANGDTLGTYDLSGYKYFTVSFFVEKTAGYNVVFKLKTANADGYYQFRAYIKNTGWQTLTLLLQQDAKNPLFPHFEKVGTASGDLKDVTAICIEFGGGETGSGNGKLADGTTIKFEKIGFENQRIYVNKLIGENIDTGVECKHDYEYTDVAATCESTGYKMGMCKRCGHIVVPKDSIVNPLVDKQEGSVITKQEYDKCLSDGIKVARFTCSCGDDYYRIVEYTPAIDHIEKDGACTGCSKEVTPAQ